MWKLGVEQGVECASKTRMGGKKKWDFKGKKYSACGEDWTYSSGCLVMLHQSPGFSNH